MTNYNSIFGYTPKTMLTLEQHLKNYAEIDVDARRLLESFHTIREKMEVNLRPIISLFPHYSEHSHEHSEHVISAIEKILGRSRIEKLSPADTWMILVCAYMHDLGMLVQEREIESDWKTEEFQRHIENCKESNDEEIKRAAFNVSSIEWTGNDLSWPVYIYRDVILLASEFYRGKHAARAIELPKRSEFKQALSAVISGDGKIPQRIQETIGNICFSHGISFDSMIRQLESKNTLLRYDFHPRFVAALLCLGDLCDLDNGRFNYVAIETFGGLTKNNLIHYYKHESVVSFNVQKDEIEVKFNIQNKQIKKEVRFNRVFSKCTDYEIQDFCDRILLETQHWMDWMTQIVQNIKLHWSEFEIYDIEAMSPNLCYKIMVDGREITYSAKNLRFSFNDDKAYELIEGYNLYNNNLAFIRELMQNSIDALKRQLWRDLLVGRWDYALKHMNNGERIDYKCIQPFDFQDNYIFDYYQIKIYVEHDPEAQYARFTIEDNGIGISKEDVENRIIKTGIRNENFSDIPEWIKPTSAFGIGLHSVFSVTDLLFIQTRCASDDKVYEINIHSGKKDGYIFMSEAENQNEKFCNCYYGTRITFLVDTYRCNFLQVEDYEFDLFGYENTSEGASYFKDTLESGFCKKVNKAVNKFTKSTMFRLTYKLNDDLFCLPAIYNDTYAGMLFKENQRNKIFGEVFIYEGFDFAVNNKDGLIILWDRKKSILLVYRIDTTNNYTCDVFCKCFCVNNANVFICGDNLLPELMHYFGGETKNILLFNRDSLTSEQKNINSDIFLTGKKVLAAIYKKMILSLSSDAQIIEFIDNAKKLAIELKTKTFTDQDILSNKLNSLLPNCEHEIKKLFIEFTFTILVRLCKKAFLSIFNEYSPKERWNLATGGYIIMHDGANDLINNDTNFFEFLHESMNLFNQKQEKEEMMNSLINIFRQEFFDIYLDYFKKYDYIIYQPDQFGDFDFRYNKKVDTSSNNMEECNSNIYLYASLIRIITYLFRLNENISNHVDELRPILSCFPGFYSSFGFDNVKDFCDIIKYPSHTIKEVFYADFLICYLPIIKYFKCKSIDINNNELVLTFDNSLPNKPSLKIKKCALKKLLSSHKHSKLIPVIDGFEYIAVDVTRYNTHQLLKENIMTYNNNAIIMWDSFQKLSDRYSGKIKTQEDIDEIISKVLPDSRNDIKPISFLLRFICQNKAFDNKTGFENVWINVCQVYEKFMHMILNLFIEK